MKKILILLCVILSAGGLLLFFERKDAPSKDSEEVITPETVVQWENPLFERQVREMLRMPTGEIKSGDLEKITTLLIYGADGVATSASPEYSLKTEDEHTFAENQNYTELKYFRSLKALSMYCVGLESLQFLGNVPSLSYINLSHCSLPEEAWPDIKPVGLYLTHCGSFDLKMLKHPEQCNELGVSGMRLEGQEELKKFKNLTMFHAAECNVKEISWILECRKLVQLGLEKNEISSLEGIESLERLEVLDLCENPIEDVAPLLQMNSLTYLIISRAVVPDWSVFDAIPNCIVGDGEY